MIMLRRWRPLTELRRAEDDMDHVRRQMFRPFQGWPKSWYVDGHVDLDVYQDAENLYVRATVPGVNPTDIDITVAEDVLAIHGEATDEKETKEAEYLHRERRFGGFRREVALPKGLDIPKAEAAYDNGVLTVTIPRSEETKARTLNIKVNEAEVKKN